MPQETGYIGVPMKFVVVYKDVSGNSEPTIPPIDGFTITKRNGTETSSQTTFINGQVTSTSTSKYTFFLTPTKLGKLTIPPIRFIVDGSAFTSVEKTINVIETPTSGALKAEITGSTGDLYLGQPVDLTLHVLVERYTDDQLGVELSQNDMFSLLSQNSQFGCFTEAIQDGRAQVRTVQGHTDEGIPTTFYEYSIQATAWPETTGPLHLDPVSIVIDYPVSLAVQQSRSFFGGDSLVIEQSKLIRATTEMPSIQVLTPPQEDRPDWYTGAVGLFDFRVVAEPTNVAIGEPITLTMRVTDLSSGPINLDYLAAPSLDRYTALTNNFKVPDKPLGGTVQGRTKTFTQTIRPRKDSITEIPPLPLTSFNPTSGEYTTSWTKTIPITVRAVETVSANDLVGGNTAVADTPTSLTEFDGGILANYVGNELLQSQTTEWSPLLITIIAFPPAACFVFVAFLYSKHRSNSEQSIRKSSTKQAIRTIQSTNQVTNKEDAQKIAHALRTLEPTLKEKQHVQSLIQRCNAAQFGGLQDESLAEDAQAFVEVMS